jgi:hypothetical protein
MQHQPILAHPLRHGMPQRLHGRGGRESRARQQGMEHSGRQAARDAHQSFRRQAGTGSAHPRYYHNLHRSMWCPGSTRCEIRLCTAVEWYQSVRCWAAPSRTAPQRTAVAPATGAASHHAPPRPLPPVGRCGTMRPRSPPGSPRRLPRMHTPYWPQWQHSPRAGRGPGRRNETTR